GRRPRRGAGPVRRPGRGPRRPRGDRRGRRRSGARRERRRRPGRRSRRLGRTGGAAARRRHPGGRGPARRARRRARPRGDPPPLAAAPVALGEPDAYVVVPPLAAGVAAAPADAPGAGAGREAPLPGADTPEAEALLDALDAAHGTAETRRTWAARLEAQGAPAVGRALALLQALPGSSLPEALEREAAALEDLVRSDAAAASMYSAELLRRGRPGRTPVE